jgi:predicted NBD/HSP70 family sugar kinase
MGGKRIRAAVATRDGLLETVAEDLPDVCDNPALNAIGERLGDQVLGQSGTRREDILGIGFGAAGEWEGLIIRWSPNNPVRDHITVCKHVSEYYGRQRQTLGANDLKAAVHAVPLYGHGRNRPEKDRLIVCAITYSDGNNIAILNRNQPYPGYHDLSQEVGHAHIEHGDHARWCGCGTRGCFEAYVGGRNVGERLRAAAAHPHLSDLELLNVGEVASRIDINAHMARMAERAVREVLRLKGWRAARFILKGTEIDIVAFDDRKRICMTGKVKWQNKPAGPKALADLEAKSELVKVPAGYKMKHLIFSKGGFTDPEAMRKGADLWDLKTFDSMIT